MKIIVGTVIKNKNKILLIKEAKKEIYGKWNFPVGHLEEGESIIEGAKRETLEETGCKVEVKNLLPIKYKMKYGVLIIYFLSELIEENDIIKKDEILEKKWFTVEEIKSMKKDELRAPDLIIQTIESIQKEEKYKLNIIQNV